MFIFFCFVSVALLLYITMSLLAPNNEGRDGIMLLFMILALIIAGADRIGILDVIKDLHLE
jgi:hypothetical protein